MLLDMLILFIAITILLFILTVILMDERPVITIPLIFAGMLFTVLCAYGFFDVGTFYVGQNATTGILEPSVYTDESYALAYPWVFFFVFLLYIILFIRVGFNLWQEALETKSGQYRR